MAHNFPILGGPDSKNEYWLNAIANDQLYVSDLKAPGAMKQLACMAYNGVPQKFPAGPEGKTTTRNLRGDALSIS